MNQASSSLALEIFMVASRLAQAGDDRDEVAYAACLAPPVDDGSTLPVEAVIYARASIARIAAMDWTHHKLANPVVTVDGERAVASIDVVIDMVTTIEVWS